MWRKSSYSGPNGGACIEVADLVQGSAERAWRKSSHSSANGGNCIEVASLSPAIAVRDSKDPHGPKLLIGRAQFRLLAKEIKSL